MKKERLFHQALILFALVALCAGLTAQATGQDWLAGWAWAIGTVPVILVLALSMVRDLLGAGWAWTRLLSCR